MDMIYYLSIYIVKPTLFATMILSIIGAIIVIFKTYTTQGK